MSAHLSDVDPRVLRMVRWHEEAVQLCLASTEHASGVGHHRADVYGPCTTHLDAAKYVAARVAAAVAAERERLARVCALADGWQAEVEDDGDGLTDLSKVLDELRAALAAEARS